MSCTYTTIKLRAISMFFFQHFFKTNIWGDLILRAVTRGRFLSRCWATKCWKRLKTLPETLEITTWITANHGLMVIYQKLGFWQMKISPVSKQKKTRSHDTLKRFRKMRVNLKADFCSTHNLTDGPNVHPLILLMASKKNMQYPSWN